MAEFGLEGYGFFWVCLELVAQQGNACKIKGERSWKRVLTYITRQKEERVDELLKAFAEIQLIDKKALEDNVLYIPKMADYSDEYTKRIRRVYGQGTDKVVLEENRREENRIDKKRGEQLHNTMKYLSNIPAKDIKEFTERFIASEDEVRSKGEDLKLYCERKGKRYSNYKSFLLNALKRDYKERKGAKSGKYAGL